MRERQPAPKHNLGMETLPSGADAAELVPFPEAPANTPTATHSSSPAPQSPPWIVPDNDVFESEGGDIFESEGGAEAHEAPPHLGTASRAAGAR